VIQDFVWTVTTILTALTTIAAGSPVDKIGNGQHRNFEPFAGGRGIRTFGLSREGIDLSCGTEVPER